VIQALSDLAIGRSERTAGATDGFFHAPRIAGSPTGTPVTSAGTAPITVQTGNARLWTYVAGTGWVGGFYYVGAWATSTGYDKNDVATTGSGSYVAKSKHTSAAASEPGVGVSWATYWAKFAVDGADGAAGSAGSDGSDGAAGAQGIQGIQGVPGSDGAPGTNGTNGSDGAPGADGADGAAGSKWYNGTTVPGAGLGVVGDHYMRSTGEYYEKTGASTWTYKGDISGADGAAGADGADGAAGAQGIQGIQGVPGSDGSAGTNGTNGSDGAPGATGAAGADGDTIIPIGAIVAWHEDYSGAPTFASISSNWARCNGAAGKPNLRDKFLRGKASDGGATGGTGGQTGTNLTTSSGTENFSPCGAGNPGLTSITINTEDNLPEYMLMEMLIRTA
jgi:hypothetical protein